MNPIVIIGAGIGGLSTAIRLAAAGPQVVVLEKNELVMVSKQFVGRKPNTTYQVSLLGRKSFEAHLK